MDTTHDSAPESDAAETPVTGSKDGDTAADHDEPYRLGRVPNTRAPYPFSERQFARLLILRSRVQANDASQDRAAA
jgi:hypothetical protein